MVTTAVARVVTFAPDVAIINLGINDCNPAVWTNKADFLPAYRALLNDLGALPSKPKIFVCRPTPPNHKRFDATRWVGLKELLPMLDQLAQEEHLQLVDTICKSPRCISPARTTSARLLPGADAVIP